MLVRAFAQELLEELAPRMRLNVADGPGECLAEDDKSILPAWEGGTARQRGFYRRLDVLAQTGTEKFETDGVNESFQTRTLTDCVVPARALTEKTVSI